MSTRGRNLSVRKSTKTNPVDIESQVRTANYDIQSQARRTNQIKGGFSNNLPSGLKEGDVLARFGPEGSIQLGVSDSRGSLRLIDIPPTFAQLPAGLSQYIDLQTGTVPPVLADFPNDGDFGQFYDSVTAALYWVRNIGGSLTFLNFLGFTGTISDTQHGDRSTTTTNMHKFPQITGTITDTQHGNRGGGSLHDVATTSAAGFLSAADKTKLDDATNAATANTIVMRGAGGGTSFSGTLNAVDVDASGQYEVDSVRVVTNRQTGWTLPTGTASRATFDTATVTTAQLAQRVFAMLQDFGSTTGHGLIDA